MHYLLMEATPELKLRLLQAIPGYEPEEILQKWNFPGQPPVIKQVSQSEDKEKIIELRTPDATLTYHYQEGRPCFVGYLFPDNEEDIEKYICFLNDNYLQVGTGRWLNPQTQCVLDVINDEDIGYMLCCTKNKVN